MKDIVIFGCGGFGRETLQIIHHINAQSPTWNVLGFAVDAGINAPARVHDLPVRSDLSEWRANGPLNVAIGIGKPDIRRKTAHALQASGRDIHFPPLIHPSVQIGTHVDIAEGAIICGGVILTTDITIHPHVHLNLSSTVGHDAVIGAFSTVSPGVNISGKVSMGDEVFVGTGANLIEGVSVGARTVIGAGAAVIRDLPADVTAVGIPARAIGG